jgi:hypothetical protein
LPNLWSYAKFFQKYGVMSSFAKHIELSLSFGKFMELCQVLPKIWNCAMFLPKLWKYVKFCKKYGVMSNFAKKIELCLSFAKK